MNSREASNGEKSKSGRNTEEVFTKLLKDTVQHFPEIKLKEKLRYGAKGKDPKQFRIKYQLEFPKENLYWLIDESSSLRSDRINGKEFIMEQVKKILKQDHDINIESYFVLPDTPDDKSIRSVTVMKERIEKQNAVTYFDGAMYMSEFRNHLEQKATSTMDQGHKSNILGNYGEKILVEAFRNQNNLVLWNDPANHVVKSSNYSLFKRVINKLCPEITATTKLKSTIAFRGDSVEKDPITQELKHVRGAGKPKTDVLIQLVDDRDIEYTLTISVKYPTNKKSKHGKVTAHEGSIEQLLDDLHVSIPDDNFFANGSEFEKLSSALCEFQEKGSKKQMSDKNVEYLDAHLKEINRWLIDYFIFGINNRVLNDHQTAKSLLIFDPDTGKCQVETVKEVEDNMLASKPATFNTPFQWTYPSKKRGKKYQIKAPFNLER